jgi:NAD(P)-dependent dehydrogenase (short-subunit alcohol dehydrogenase family)
MGVGVFDQARRDLHDMAAVCDGELRDVKEAREVDAQHSRVISLGILSERLGDEYAGVVNERASLTKGGLSAATKSLAIEYAKVGIRVNAVAPGIIKTPMHPVETHAQLAKMHPLGRMGEISDIVGAILYLESADFVTGETIHVDGGQSAGH